MITTYRTIEEAVLALGDTEDICGGVIFAKHGWRNKVKVAWDTATEAFRAPNRPDEPVTHYVREAGVRVGYRHDGTVHGYKGPASPAFVQTPD